MSILFFRQQGKLCPEVLINLTPLIPLSFKGEGELVLEERQSLSSTLQHLLIKGEGEVVI
jgi:hypothetical protein